MRLPEQFPCLLLLALLPGCLECCVDSYSGTPGGAAELEATARSARGGHAVVTFDGSVDIVVGGQGGRMVAAGVRARNVDVCGIRIDGRLAPDRGQAMEAALQTTLARESDGWARSESELFFVGCPPALDGVPHQLELSATDRDGRTAVFRARVVPRCSSDDYCRQQCGPRDGGTP